MEVGLSTRLIHDGVDRPSCFENIGLWMRSKTIPYPTWNAHILFLTVKTMFKYNLTKKQSKDGRTSSVFRLVIAVAAFVLIFQSLSPPADDSGARSNLKSSNESSIRVPIATSTVYECNKKPVDEMEASLKSQAKEDQKLLGIFNGLCGGKYLEMGALDGVRFSNTYVFQQEFGWNGVLVEGSPENFQKLVENRPKEVANVHAAVCETEREVHFVDGHKATSGIWEFSSEAYRNQWWPDLKIEDIPPVSCLPLTKILDQKSGGYTFFDFYSLDIEGAELSALKSLDFNKYSFGVLFVEANKYFDKNDELKSFIISKGYRFVELYERSFWFVHKDFEQIYRHVPNSIGQIN